MDGDSTIESAEMVEMENDGNIESAEYYPQFSRGSFRIGLDSPLQFVAIDEEWLSTTLVVLEAYVSCREAREPAIDCPIRNDALTKCMVNASGRSAHVVVVLAPFVVDDFLKLILTYHGWKVVKTLHAGPYIPM